MKNSIKNKILFFAVMFFASCTTIGPEYKSQEMRKQTVQTKEEWSESAVVNISPADVIQKDWWTNFKDPYLNRLVEETIAGNYDLKTLVSRIQKAEAAITVTKADLLPSLGLSTEGTELSKTSQGGDSSAETSKRLNIKTGLTWEIDLWGKNRKGFLAEKAEYKATGADYRAGYLRAVSEIAQTYFQVRQIDKQTALTQNFYKGNKKILKIYQRQYEEGLISNDKILRQKAEVKGLEQDLLELERQRKNFENRVATLLGKPAGEFKIPDTRSQEPLQTVKVPAGLPSDLLSRRPDIIAAEYRVLKAYHLIGQAQAARLPSVSLTGSGGGGLVSTVLSGLVKQWTLGIMPNISFPIFDAGRAKARVAINEAEARIAEDEYRKTVMTAFEEVENALVNLDNRTKQKAVLEEKTDNMRRVHSQTMKKLENGIISYLEILDTERELLNTEKSLLEMHRSLLDDNIILFKALGGGWDKEVVQ